MKRILILAAIVPLMALQACNTTSGIGQDVQSVGSEIEGAAEGAK